MVKATHDDLGRRLSALRADFAELGTRAAQAAAALGATLPPAPALLDELSAARHAFTELRNAVLQQAGSLSLVLDVERLSTLRDLEPVVAAIGTAEARRGLFAAWEETRDSALLVLDRVIALIHREDARFGPLADCQERARELHGVVSGAQPQDPERAVAMLTSELRPYTDLLALVDGWNALDDDRCVALQEAITQLFGRPLALAALRGKLVPENALPPSAPEPPERAAPEVSHAPTADVPPAPAYAAPAYAAPPTPETTPEAPPRRSAPPAPAYAAPAYAAPPTPETTPEAPPRRSAPPAPAPAYTASAPPAPPATGVPDGYVTGIGAPGVASRKVGPGGVAAAGGSAVGEIRLSPDKIAVETPQARREREQLLERLALESAPWWIAARNGWKTMRDRDVTFAAAARDYLGRFPTLLSVPLPKSAEGSGQVAEGYALLLAHIEKQEEGFVREALARLNPQFTTRDKDQYPLGQELYLYIVAEGRLYKTYPDFVKEVVVHALPQASPWVQGGLIEADGETRLFARTGRLGSTQEQTQTMTVWKERIGPHVFTATTGPLTTRFFSVRTAGATLSDSPEVEIALKENDAVTDHAWLVTVPAGATTQPLEAKKHRAGGTKLAGLGTEFSTLWIAVFNADPSSERNYELTITLRRKSSIAAGPKTPAAAPAPAPSAGKFFSKSR